MRGYCSCDQQPRCSCDVGCDGVGCVASNEHARASAGASVIARPRQAHEYWRSAWTLTPPHPSPSLPHPTSLIVRSECTLIVRSETDTDRTSSVYTDLAIVVWAARTIIMCGLGWGGGWRGVGMG